MNINVQTMWRWCRQQFFKVDDILAQHQLTKRNGSFCGQFGLRTCAHTCTLTHTGKMCITQIIQ